MARTVAECYNYIVTNLVTEFAAQGITINPNTWSQANRLRLMCHSFAVAQSLAEQLMDNYISEAQTIQNNSAAGSPQWIQDKVFKFQYSATTPQNVIMTDGIPSYAVVNPALRIVTACAVSSGLPMFVNVKAAKGTTTLSALSALELSALQNYVNYIGNVGIVYSVTSQNPDRLYLEGEIYYKGSYSAVIAANVIQALNDYLLNLSHTRFGGDILVSDIENVIRNVEGVNDVSMKEIKTRYSTQGFGTGTTLKTGYDLQQRKYNSSAGYLIQEDTVGQTFTDKLTFVAE